MNLNISYSSNTLTNASAAFFSAVNYVVNAFDSLFTNAVTSFRELNARAR